MNAFQHVVVGLDLESANARPLLYRARQIAEPNEIEVIHVCDHLHSHHEKFGTGAFASSEDLNDQVMAVADAHLEELCDEYGITHHHVLAGKTIDRMHEYAEDHADLVVIGSHGHNIFTTMFGSTSNAMLHNTPCDVLAVHVNDNADYEPGVYKNILVAVDLAEDTSRVMEHALRIAEAAGTSLNVCHVYTSNDYQTMAHEQHQLETLGERYDIDSDALHCLFGNPAHAVQQMANDTGTDLIVVGARGSHGLELLMGSMPNAMLHGAHYDTLSVRVHH